MLFTEETVKKMNLKMATKKRPKGPVQNKCKPKGKPKA
jgi:hypothetical protein